MRLEDLRESWKRLGGAWKCDRIRSKDLRGRQIDGFTHTRVQNGNHEKLSWKDHGYTSSWHRGYYTGGWTLLVMQVKS